MSGYRDDDDYRHGTPPRLGVLMVNLGTPEDTSTPAVRRYLRQFLSDPRVVEVPRFLWFLILNLAILVFRPRRSAAAYRQIWSDRGSPLMVHSKLQSEALRDRLSQRLYGPFTLKLAMTYGQPDIESALESLRRDNARRLVVLPMYPQYSATTTGAVFDAVTRVLQRTRWVPELRFINQYHDVDGYIAALANSVREHWDANGRGDHLLMSFHGIPRRYLESGDPYHCQCHKTGRLLAEALELVDDDWTLAFQSRVGREEWLRPYTDETVERLGREGVGRLDVICPGFSADCLETLEEMAMQNAEIFEEAGGGELHYIPCLNERPDHIGMLADLVARHCGGWPEADHRWKESDALRAAEKEMEEARKLGAPK